MAGTVPTANETSAINAWNEKDKMVIFILSQNITNAMIGHIQDLDTSKEVWETLKKLYNYNEG